MRSIGPESDTANLALIALLFEEQLPVPAARYLNLHWNVSPEYPEA
jgi:hypothetical protein